jgi:hypothetical protein
MATLEQLSTALVNADAAGDVQAARTLAGEIKRMRGQQSSKGALGYVDDVVRSLASGVTLGWADEFAAKADELTGRGGTYEQNLKRERARDEQIPSSISIPGQIGGAVAGTIAAAPLVAGTRAAGALSRLPSAIRFGGLGATGGAVAGAGDAESGQRLGGAATGAVTGGVLGAATPSIVRGVSRVAGGVRNAFKPRAQAAADLSRAITRDDTTPAALLSRAQQLRQVRPGVATLADAGGENVRGLVERVAQTPGAGRTTVVPALTGRQQGQAIRLSSDLRSLTGTSRSAMQAMRETMDSRANAARPLYRAAYEQFDAPLNTPELERLLSADEVSKAVQSAIVKARGRSISDGFTGGFNAKMQMTPAGLSKTAGPDRRVAFPNLQLWDYAKRELDDMASSAARAGKNNEASYIGGLSRQLRNELDNLTTDPATGQSAYRAARDAWSGPTAYLDAIEQGRNVLSRNMSAEEMTAAFRELSTAEQSAFREGAISSIISKMGNDPAQMADMTKYLRSPEMRAKIAAIMPTPDAAQRWMQRLDFEVSSSQLAGRSLGNSATARRLAEQEDAKNIVGDLVMDAMSGGSSVSLLRRAVGAGPRWLRDTLRSRSDRVLADTLINPQSMERLPDILRQVTATQRVPSELTNAATTMGGVNFAVGR